MREGKTERERAEASGMEGEDLRGNHVDYVNSGSFGEEESESMD